MCDILHSVYTSDSLPLGKLITPSEEQVRRRALLTASLESADEAAQLASTI